MSTLPAQGYMSDNARTESEMKDSFEALRNVIAELLGGAAATELTLASGNVLPTAAIHTIDTEADAPSDDLENIIYDNHPDGRLLLIRAEDDARTVVVKHAAGGAGQVVLTDGADFSLDDTKKWLLVKRTGTNWNEVYRAYGNDMAAARAFLEVPTITSGTVAVDPASIAANSTTDVSVAVVGLEVGDNVIANPLAALENGLVCIGTRVGVIDQLIIRISNTTAAPIDGASMNWFWMKVE